MSEAVGSDVELPPRIAELVERSKNDGYTVAGSELREVAQALRESQTELRKVREELEEARSKLEVLDGEFCAPSTEEDSSKCGMCIHCLQEGLESERKARTEAEAKLAEWELREQQACGDEETFEDLIAGLRSLEPFWAKAFEDERTKSEQAEAKLRSASEIIEQYPMMVRNILGARPVRNVSELEAQAKSWLAASQKEGV